MSTSCALLSVGGVAISGICPIAGPLINSYSFKGCALSFLATSTFGASAGIAKVAKEITK